MMDNPRQSVREKLSPLVSVNFKLPVTVIAGGCSPQPAGIGLVYFGPESGNEAFRQNQFFLHVRDSGPDLSTQQSGLLPAKNRKGRELC